MDQMSYKFLLYIILFSTCIFMLGLSIMGYAVSLTTKGMFVRGQTKKSSLRNLEQWMKYKVNEIEIYEDRMDTLQRIKSPFLIWLKYILKVILSNKSRMPISNLLIILISVMSGFFLIGLFGQGLLLSIILIFLITIVFLNFLNILALWNRRKTRKDVLNFLNIFHTNYMRSDSIEGAISKTIDALDKKSWMYKVMEDYMINYKRLGRSRVECIDILKRDLGSFRSINIYFDLVKKAETSSPSYKQATSAIPENFELEWQLYDDFIKSVMVLFLAFTITMGILFYSAIVNSFNFEYIEMIKTNYKTRLVAIAPYIIATIAGVIVFIMSTTKND